MALAGSTALWLGESDSTPPVDGQPSGAALPAGHEPSATIEDQMQEYVEAAELLQASIRERGTKLSPETLVVLEKNLATMRGSKPLFPVCENELPGSSGWMPGGRR